MFRNGEEYLLDHDPIDLAERVLADLRAGVRAPTTPGKRPDLAALQAQGVISSIPPISQTSIHPNNILGPDSRVSYDHASASWPAMTSLMVEGRNCTATVIGTRMAATAAHCFFNGTEKNLGTFRYIPYASNTAPTQPYGTFTATQIYYPSGWNGSDWSFDYARVEFAAGTFSNWGWVGTSESGTEDEACNMWGYPLDKPYPQLWLKSGIITKGGSCPNGPLPCLARHSFYCNTRRSIRHSLDIVNGDSGAGLLDSYSSALVGIQSTQWRTIVNGVTYDYFNEAKAWDVVVYNYFAASGIWP
jgi:V8-like Glu-specific endopeptidase